MYWKVFMGVLVLFFGLWLVLSEIIKWETLGVA